MNETEQGLPTNTAVLVSRDMESAYALAASTIVQLADDAVRARGKFTIALSGGSTPKRLFELLASPAWQSKVPWTKTEFFFGDERYVPPTDSSSNFHMVQQAMLSRVPVPPDRVHRVLTEKKDPAEAAQLYEQEIRRVVPATSQDMPSFDLNLLGLGTNGHTASLFPYQPALHEKKKLVVAEYIEEVKMTRVTMTAPLINASHNIVFLAMGAEKAVVVRDVVSGVFDPERLPAQLVRPSEGKLTWILEPASAAKLPDAILKHVA